MTGSAAFWRLTVCRNSSPFIPGSFRSVTTRSMGSALSILSPVSASPAEKVTNPSSPRFNSSKRRIFASSSTIKIAGISLESSICLCSRNHQMSLVRRHRGLAGSGKKYYKARARPLAFGRVAVRAFNANRSMVAINNLRNDRQAKSNTSLLGGHKRIENLLAQLLGNAGPRICDTHFNAVCASAFARFPPGFHRLDSQNASALRAHGIVRVLHDVDEGLLAQAL